jgi:hypothetical protein
MKDKYTFDDLIEAVDEEKNRIRIIIEYLCNKNSKPLLEGGIDYEQFFDDIQDLEKSLMD